MSASKKLSSLKRTFNKYSSPSSELAAAADHHQSASDHAPDNDQMVSETSGDDVIPMHKFNWQPVEVSVQQLDQAQESGFIGLQQLSGEDAKLFLTGMVKDDTGDKEERPPPPKKKKRKKKKKKKKKQDASAPSKSDSTSNNSKKSLQEQDIDVDALREQMGHWAPANLHWRILAALRDQHFVSPTPIQQVALQSAILHRKDIIGAAETGSGKTLAFLLPIVQRWLQDQESGQLDRSKPYAVILTPTRELAQQIATHTRNISSYIAGFDTVTIIGGMSEHKQLRLLKKCPAVVVGTPGRMWDFIAMNYGPCFLEMVGFVKFFVLDEADRMVESGHFEELSSILGRLPPLQAKEKAEEADALDKQMWNAELEDSYWQSVQNRNLAAAPHKRSTYVYSATLAMQEGERRHVRAKKRRVNRNQKATSTADKLQQMLDFHHTVDIIDLTINNNDDDGGSGQSSSSQQQLSGVSSNVEQTMIRCKATNKDTYLYYFLRRFLKDGQTLVFVNAITQLKRIFALLEIAGLPVYAVHAQMQQRQRLKRLERFIDDPYGILICTDVASRGIDIAGIAHVVHYDAPPSLDVYVHRTGRTARAGSRGVSLLLINPKEATLLKRLSGIVEFSTQQGYMAQSNEILQHALAIDKIVHAQKSAALDQRWNEKTRGVFGSGGGDEEQQQDQEEIPTAFLDKQTSKRLKRARAQLRSLVGKPFIPRGLSTNYITKTPELMKRLTSSWTALQEIDAKKLKNNNQADNSKKQQQQHKHPRKKQQRRKNRKRKGRK